MKTNTLLLAFSLLVLYSCDCMQRCEGVVLDKQTKTPITAVKIGNYNSLDSVNSNHVYSNEKGAFVFTAISGGLYRCPDLILGLAKPGYKTIRIVRNSYSFKDTFYLEKLPQVNDVSIKINRADFDMLVINSIRNLQNYTLDSLRDDQHVEIMRCLNTIGMRSLHGGNYDELTKLAEQKNYVKAITLIYPNWIPNRGMGMYFPKLNMELYGTPAPYAVYDIIP